MQLEHQAQNGIDVIKLPQRILMADARAARKGLKRFTRTGQPLLALDMGDTEFIDSSGLAVLVNCLQASRRRNGEVCLFGMQEPVQTLFEITRLNTVFPIEVRRDDAIRRLSS
jgi:anti-sigma B factor antagonist